jgi:mRNA-degrading endonuclease toxin of MazEF toxin-antitoxin module
VAQITSQRADEIAHDEVQLPSEILSRPSKVKCYHILAIQKDRLLPENLRGDVDVRTMQGIDEALKIALDLW